MVTDFPRRESEGKRLPLGIILGSCAAVYASVVIIQAVLRRQWTRARWEALALVILIGIALLVNNATTGIVGFGEGASPLATVAVMFVAIIAGIAARYIFYLQQGHFSWLDFFKPLTISPIALLPLLGSVQTTRELNSMQVVSFGVLAFQNGFFWQAILAGARPATQVIADKAEHRRTH